jgi:hypothetical protein
MMFTRPFVPSLPPSPPRADVGWGDRFDRWFFGKGQVVETVRGEGIYQEGMDRAIEKLEGGNWVRTLSSLSLSREREREREWVLRAWALMR